MSEHLLYEENAPNVPAIYFLFYKGQLRYIGSTSNLSVRIYDQKCFNRCRKWKGKFFDEVRYIECDHERRMEWEARCIFYFQPVENRNCKKRHIHDRSPYYTERQQFIRDMNKFEQEA